MGARDQVPSQLLMAKESLRELPALRLPEGYSARHFRAGDEKFWERIVIASFGGEHDFDRNMAAHPAFKPERVWFLCDREGIPVATASAWYRKEWLEDTGYLHMVGIVPEHEGKRLGYAVSLAALLQMAKEGRARAVLHTDDNRLPAIKTYLNLGFGPELAEADHSRRWQALAGVLKQPIVAANTGGETAEFRP